MLVFKIFTALDAAKVAELADAPDLGSGGRKAMGVRVPPFAPKHKRYLVTYF